MLITALIKRLLTKVEINKYGMYTMAPYKPPNSPSNAKNVNELLS